MIVNIQQLLSNPQQIIVYFPPPGVVVNLIDIALVVWLLWLFLSKPLSALKHDFGVVFLDLFSCIWLIANMII